MKEIIKQSAKKMYIILMVLACVCIFPIHASAEAILNDKTGEIDTSVETIFDSATLQASSTCSASLLDVDPSITVMNFVQTENGTTTTSIGMQWDPVEGAVEYYIYEDRITDINAPAYKTKDNFYVVQFPSSGWHEYVVMAVGSDGRYLINRGHSNVVEMKVASAKPSDVSGFNSYYTDKKELVALWDEQSDCDAYEVLVYDKNGIVVDQQEVSPRKYYTQNATKLYGPIGKLYQVRVRAINKNWNGDIVAGRWSKVKYICVPKSFESTLKSSTGRTVITKWKKVSGVTSYTLAGSTNRNSGYKTIKKLSPKKKMKVSYSKIKGKKFSYYRYYYVRLRMKAKVKLDGKRSEKNFDAFRTFQITPR